MTVSLFALHAAIYLYLKTQPDLQARVRRAINPLFYAFFTSAMVIAALAMLFSVAIFPNFMLSTIDPAYSVTLKNARSSAATLQTMLIIAWLTLLFAAPGILLAIWALLTMGLGRTRMFPTTTDKTQLVMSGPYAFVRHPMYSGLLWSTTAIVINYLAWWRVALWIALLLVLIAKAHVEEKSLHDRFAEYGAYRRRVGNLVPRIRN